MDFVSQSSRVSAFVLGLRIALTQTVRGHCHTQNTQANVLKVGANYAI